MTPAIYLAFRYLQQNKTKFIVMVLCLALTIAIPIVIQLSFVNFEQSMLRRAESTPIVVGARGSQVDLVLHSLYFDKFIGETIEYRQVDQLSSLGLGRVIPIFGKYTAAQKPVIGTTLEYFDFRQLHIAQGRSLQTLGECVVGAKVARDLKIQVDDSIVTDAENIVNIADAYPLKMKVVGIFVESGTSDDQAIFVDLKTSWVIANIGHGHDDVTQLKDEGALLGKKGSRLIASAAVTSFTEINAANIDSVHFHGDPQTFPLTGIIVVPNDQRGLDLTLGEFVAAGKQEQAVLPQRVVRRLVDTVFRFKNLALAVTVAMFVVAVLFALLVTLLSIRLRARELQTYYLLGCSRFLVARLLFAEFAILLAFSLSLAGALNLIVWWSGIDIYRQWLA